MTYLDATLFNMTYLDATVYENGRDQYKLHNAYPFSPFRQAGVRPAEHERVTNHALHVLVEDGEFGG